MPLDPKPPISKVIDTSMFSTGTRIRQFVMALALLGAVGTSLVASAAASSGSSSQLDIDQTGTPRVRAVSQLDNDIDKIGTPRIGRGSRLDIDQTGTPRIGRTSEYEIDSSLFAARRNGGSQLEIDPSEFIGRMGGGSQLEIAQTGTPRIRATSQVDIEPSDNTPLAAPRGP